MFTHSQGDMDVWALTVSSAVSSLGYGIIRSRRAGQRETPPFKPAECWHCKYGLQRNAANHKPPKYAGDWVLRAPVSWVAVALCSARS